MKRLFRTIYILWVVFRFGLDQMVLQGINHPGLHLFVRRRAEQCALGAPELKFEHLALNLRLHAGHAGIGRAGGTGPCTADPSQRVARPPQLAAGGDDRTVVREVVGLGLDQ